MTRPPLALAVRLLPVLLIMLLAGCVVVPEGGYGPGYVAAPVYVAPVYPGYGYGYGYGYRQHHWR